jgi:hypothetical protein
MVGPLPGSSMESGQSYFPSDSPSPSPTWARRGASFLAACELSRPPLTQHYPTPHTHVTNPSPFNLLHLPPPPLSRQARPLFKRKVGDQQRRSSRGLVSSCTSHVTWVLLVCHYHTHLCQGRPQKVQAILTDVRTGDSYRRKDRRFLQT